VPIFNEGVRIFFVDLARMPHFKYERNPFSHLQDTSEQNFLDFFFFAVLFTHIAKIVVICNHIQKMHNRDTVIEQSP